jgi:hypothetical protein
MRRFSTTQIRVIESPWMPLHPDLVHSYPQGMTANKSNVASRIGCPSILSTTTLQANGTLAACCGLGIRTVPELQLGDFSQLSIADADKQASNDFLKRWIRVDGPEAILAWAANHDNEIEWEDMYAHQCQACLRLYKDERVRKVIASHFSEKVVDVLFREVLLYHFSPDKPKSPMDGSNTEAAEQSGQPEPPFARVLKT